MNKRSLILLLTILLSACGFQPLQGTEYRSSLGVDLSSININVDTQPLKSMTSFSTSTDSTPPRHYGELLKAEIRDRVNPLNSSAPKLYDMKITYAESNVSIFVRPDGTAGRGNLVYNSAYTITRISDQKVVANGSVSSVASYNSSPTADYAAYMSLEDARKRAVLDLAQTYELRLAALLPTLNDPKATAIEKIPTDLPVLQPVHGYENSTSGY